MKWERGDRVVYEGADHRFVGRIVVVFDKLRRDETHLTAPPRRCVVQNDDGVLHILNPAQLKPLEKT